jgi:hypothetical protein
VEQAITEGLNYETMPAPYRKQYLDKLRTLLAGLFWCAHDPQRALLATQSKAKREPSKS